MSKHTPGPWKWWASNSWRRLKHDTGRGGTVNVLEPCVCPDGHPDLIISDADMRLIAVAPDMLSELRAVLTFLEDEIIHGIEQDVVREEGTTLAEARKRADSIAALIKQASGEL